MNISRIVYWLSIALIVFLSFRIGKWVFRYNHPVYVTETDKQIIPVDSIEILNIVLEPNAHYERVTTTNVMKTTNGFLMFKDSIVSTDVQTLKIRK